MRSSSSTRKAAENGGNNIRSSSKGNKSLSNSTNKQASRTNSSSKKTKKKAKSAKGPLVAVLVIILLLVGSAAVLYFMGFFEKRYEVTLSDGTIEKLTNEELQESLATTGFPEGITINGISVSGKTVDEAYSLLLESAPEAPLDVDIKLSLDGEEIPIDILSLGLNSNLREVVETAMAENSLKGNESSTELQALFNKREAIKSSPITYESSYTVNQEGLDELVSEILTPYATEVKEASITGFDPETLEFLFEESSNGYSIDMASTALEIKNMLDSNNYEGVVTVVASVEEPEMTSEELSALVGFITESSSTTTSSSSRNHNINTACERINGLVLQPGETFSFNGFIGQRTEANGFQVAGTLQAGSVVQDYGGGVCQVTSMIYQSCVKANLEVVERNPHIWPSSYAVAGTDAAVDWPSQDFKFTNSSHYPLAIVANWDANTRVITIGFYGELLPDGQHIEFEGGVISRSPYTTEYIPAPTRPVGEQASVREGHDGVVATSKQVWYDREGNVIEEIVFPNTYYTRFSHQVEVGVLCVDGSIATINTETGEITSEIPTLPSETPPSDPALPSETPSATPSETPPVPPTEPTAPVATEPSST